MYVIPPVNYLAILVAAIASFVLGFLWHGPLFGKLWISLSGITPEQMEAAKQKSMVKPMVGAFLAMLVMSYVMANVYDFASAYYGVVGITMGLMVAFWNWLGFVVTVSLNSVFWEGRSWKLWFFNVTYQLLTMALMAAIISVWA